ncbi:MAG: bile acid:sodium symporter family protein, partial [Corynebacterium sp.]
LKYAIGDELYQGILFLCLVPSTVQSSVAFTSIARGNIPGAIVSASASNLIGVFATPVLVLLLMSGADGGLHIDTSVFVNIALQLLAPFVAGQVLRNVPGVSKVAGAKPTSYVDKISIGLVVYVAFSEGIVMGVWSSVSWVAIVGICVGSVVAVYGMLWLTSFTARHLGFDYGDQVAIQFCGTKKSLASGLPIAAVLFSGGAGLVIVPLMIFHQVQLMICSGRAATYAAKRPENTW